MKSLFRFHQLHDFLHAGQRRPRRPSSCNRINDCTCSVCCAARFIVSPGSIDVSYSSTAGTRTGGSDVAIFGDRPIGTHQFPIALSYCFITHAFPAEHAIGRNASVPRNTGNKLTPSAANTSARPTFAAVGCRAASRLVEWISMTFPTIGDISPALLRRNPLRPMGDQRRSNAPSLTDTLKRRREC